MTNLQTQARQFLTDIKDLKLPDGEVKNSLPTTVTRLPANPRRSLPERENTGFSIAMTGLAEFIFRHSELQKSKLKDDIDILHQRIGSDRLHMSDLELLENTVQPTINSVLSDITICNPDELKIKETMLREKLTIGGKSVFEVMRLALKNIARDNELMLDDNWGQMTGTNGSSMGEKEKDEGT